jgi:hypothetical protein
MMAERKVRSCTKQWKGQKRIHNSGKTLRGNRPHGRNTCKLENYTNTDVKEIVGWHELDSSGSGDTCSKSL